MRTLFPLRVLPLSVCLMASAAPALQPDAQAQDLRRLSFEELMQIDVMSVSRSPEPWVEAAAAISVITAEDIRRYGAVTLADALRLADGVSVARFNSGTWAISTRGFTATTNNKLLVQIDGRSVYTQLFGGVFWEMQHVLMSDIDRIEVIRGPAGTLWGPNAVNGVINVITKSSAETQGALLRLDAGSRLRHHTAIRYGGTLGTDASYRVYAVANHFASPQFEDGTEVGEDRSLYQTGLRADWSFTGGTRLVLQGDANVGRLGLANRADAEMWSGNVTGQLTRPFSPRSSVQVVGYVDRAQREVPLQSWFRSTVYDIEAQNNLRLGSRYQVVWGGGWRVTQSHTRSSSILFFDPDDRTIHQGEVFAQGEMTVTPDVFLTLGTRGERATVSGFESQPSVQVRYAPDRRVTLWSALSRAVRTPTRFDQDLRIRVNDVVVIRGDRDFASEKLVAYEVGTRWLAHPAVFFEASVFYHDYDDLRSQEPTAPTGIPIVLRNLYDGRIAGIELSTNVEPVDRWLLHASYTHQDIDLEPAPGSRDATRARAEAEDPEHLFALRSYVNLPGAIELDAFFRAVGQLRVSQVPAYRELDLRLGWRANDRIDLSVIGRDLLHDRHPEFGGGSSQLRHFQREIIGRLTWRIR